MPEGEPQFDPNQPVDEPVEPTSETEPSLEQLKDPKYWEQEFQKQWEAKAGQKKNWSGLVEMDRQCPGNFRMVAATPKGVILSSDAQSGDNIVRTYYLNKLDGEGNQAKSHIIISQNYISSGKHADYEDSLLRTNKVECILPDKTHVRVGNDQQDFAVTRGEHKQYIRLRKLDESYSDSFRYRTFSVTGDGKLIFCFGPKGHVEWWSSPYYVAYWKKVGSYDPQMRQYSIAGWLNRALDDITEMSMERIQGIQINSAMDAFSKRFPNRKKDREEWQNCTDVANAFQGGFEGWRKSKEVPDTAISRSAPPRDPSVSDLSLSQAPRLADRGEE